MVSGTHRFLQREGRNNRSNPDFQTFLRGLYSIFLVHVYVIDLLLIQCLIAVSC